MAKQTVIFYSVVNDLDDLDHPNVFVVQKPAEDVKLKDIMSKFPLPGRYHFRFKIKYETSFLWRDLVNEESPVPLYNSRVILKVTRISWTDQGNVNKGIYSSQVPQRSFNNKYASGARQSKGPPNMVEPPQASTPSTFGGQPSSLI